MPRIRLDPDGTGNSQLGGIDTPLLSNDAANMDYVDTVAAAIALGAVPSGNTLPTMNTVAGQAFILLATDGSNTPGYYYRNSANNAWIKDDTQGGGGIRLWQRSTTYTAGEVIYTDDTSTLFNAAVRNKIYRVERDFESTTTFDTTNLAIIGERNTTYAIEAGTSTTANSADITLVGSDVTEDDITLTGGDNVTITRNSDSQITIAADAGVDIPSGTTLPTAGTTAGDYFFLRAIDGTNLPGLYERNVANDAWIAGNTDTDTTYTAGTGLSFDATVPTQFNVDNPFDPDLPLSLWAPGTAYAVGDQVLHDGGSDVNSIYISRAVHTSVMGSPPSTNQDQWHLVRSGIVSVQGPDDTNPAPLTGNDTLHFLEGTGINIVRRSGSAEFTFSATDMGVDIPSGTSLPTTGTAAGDFFFLQADEGTNLQGLYERNSANTAWIPGNTERTDAEIDERANARVAALVELWALQSDTTTDIPTGHLGNIETWAYTDNSSVRLPDNKMSVAALQRVQEVRLVGTTLHFYYATGQSGDGDFTVDVSNLADFPFEHFTNLSQRNAFTGHGNRSIFATVTDDSPTSDGTGSFATYVLTRPPSAGAATQTTTDANWDRITPVDSIINTVCVRVYNEVTGMFDTESLGTVTPNTGLTEEDANRFYLRRDGALGNLADVETARENLGVPATTDLATVEFPNSDVETRLENIEFNDAGDQITFRNSDGGTQSFTGGGAPNGGYPTVGGIALEQLGSVTHAAGDDHSWPTGGAQVFGENADMITYTPGSGSGNQTVNGVLTQNTGSTIDIGAGSLDLDITITAITGASLTAGFAILLPMGNADTEVINTPYSVVLPPVNFNALPARLTVRVPLQSSATSDWVDGGTIGLIITERNSSERPFTYQVNSIRLSYTTHDFHKVGGAPDVQFAANDGDIHPLESVSVTGGSLTLTGGGGTLTFAGGGDGDVMSSDVITAWTSGTNYETGRLVYTTTGNATQNWRRNATAYSSDSATAAAEMANSPDSTDGAALWAVLPPVVNTDANSPIVVDRGGFNVGVVDAQLRRVDASGRRLDLTPTAVTAGTYTNPHVTVDTYGRVVGALNGTALTDLPHTGYSYSRQDNLSDNLYTNRTQDVYNILGLHLAFNESAVDVAEGTELYIFDNGNADTGTHRLTLRRNSEPETDIFEGHTFVWDVVFGFDWLEQFLGPAAEGSSTRDLDLTATDALSAFSSLYTRNTITRPAVLERLGSGEVRWVYPQDAVDGDTVTANNTVTKGAINTAVNSRLQVTGTPAANLIPKISAFRSTTDFDVTWQADEQGSGMGATGEMQFSGNTANTPPGDPTTMPDEWNDSGVQTLVTATETWQYDETETAFLPAGIFNFRSGPDNDSTILTGSWPTDGTVYIRFDTATDRTTLATYFSVATISNSSVSTPTVPVSLLISDGTNFAFYRVTSVQGDGTDEAILLDTISESVTGTPVSGSDYTVSITRTTNPAARWVAYRPSSTAAWQISPLNQGSGTSGGGVTLTADAVEALDLDFSTENIPQIGGEDISTVDRDFIPVYFDLSSSGQAQNPSLRVASTATHYALVRSDGYGVITVFNSDGTLASNAASSLNTLENNDPPFVVFLPLSADTYFAPAVDTPEQMHDDLREWVGRDFEVQLNPHPDVGTITGHTFTLGGQTGTVSNVSDNGRVFEISLTDAQRGLATTAINPTNNNHIDMAFSWVHSGVTHTWTNPINLIEDLGTEQTIGDFLVRRGTQEGIEADTVAGTVTDELYLTGGDIGVFGNINNLGIANGVRYLLTFTNVPAGVTNLSNQVAAGDTYLITTPGGSSFSPAGVVFQTVRRVTNGVAADTAPNFNLYNRGGNAPSSEHVTFTLSSFSTGNPGLEIVNRENNAIIFRLSPTGDLEIAGSLTQNNVAQ